MERFLALKHSLPEARRLLRYRFAKNLLPAPPPPSLSSDVVYEDRAILKLLDGLTIESARQTDCARAHFEAVRATYSVIPDFETLLRAGWLRQIRGRIYVDVDVSFGRLDMPWVKALRDLESRLHRVTYKVGDLGAYADDLISLVATMREQPDHVGTLLCRSPAWVAARSWEQLVTRCGNAAEALPIWLDRWRMLGYPQFAPRQACAAYHADAMIEQVVKHFEESGTFITWDDLSRRIALRNAVIRQEEDLLNVTVDLRWPTTVLERLLQLEQLERSYPHEVMGLLLRSAPNSLALLLAQIEADEYGAAPHPLATTVLTLAIDRPEVLAVLRWRIKQHPLLLADLCLCPKTSAVACFWVAIDRENLGAWDRHIIEPHDDHTRQVSFDDALSMADHHLRQGALEPSEFAALIPWTLEMASRTTGTMQPVYAQRLKSILQSLLDQTDAVLTPLAEELRDHPRGSSALASALSVIALGMLIEEVQPRPYANAYLQLLNDESRAMVSAYLDNKAAFALLSLIFRLKAAGREMYLYPIDVSQRIESGAVLESNRFTLVYDVLRKLRCHLSTLCRAVIGWQGAVPPDLIHALIANIEEGFWDDAECGWMDVFSSRFEMFHHERATRSMATDIAQALGRLEGEQRSNLLEAVLKTREPLMLAQLQSQSPQSAQVRIGERLAVLTAPGAANHVWSLTEMQLRIEHLLNAGELDAAEHFLSEEEAATTAGKVPDRDLVRLRLHLRLLYQRKHYQQLFDFQLLDGDMQRSNVARDSLDFFRALAWMDHPNDSLTAERLVRAADVFGRLYRQRHDVPAYAVNYFAARIRALIPTDIFGAVENAHRIEARKILSDAYALAPAKDSWTHEDRDVFDINLALLLLAIGSPQDALHLLAGIQSTKLHVVVTAYSAVALARASRSDDAIAMLEVAMASAVNESVLQAAWRQIKYGESYSSPVLTAVDEDTNARSLLLQLRGRPPAEQAAILIGGDNPVEVLILEYVRGSSNMLMDLAFVLKPGKAHPREDDLTSLLGKLLQSRTHFMSWMWHEQSRGGVTHAGNSGARDLVLIGNNASTYAVLEAVVCDRPLNTRWTNGELISHYLKLPSYASCKLFFHVVYSYADDANDILRFMEDIAEHHSPQEFTYVKQTPLTDEGSYPPGFIAQYQGASGNLTIVILVIDLYQSGKRDAATKAKIHNPRTRRKDTAR